MPFLLQISRFTAREEFERQMIDVYGTWHQCRLRKAERGIKKGTLCDACIEEIKARVVDFDNAVAR